MNILLFTCFEYYTTKHKLEHEFLVKNLSLFNLFDDYNVTVLDRTNNSSFYESCNEVINGEVKYIKTKEDINVNDYDAFYTMGNFINFHINKIKGKEFTTTDDDFDNYLHKTVYRNYQDMVGFIKDNDITVHQFMSDPLDFIYPNSIILTPDTENSDFWDDTLNYHNDRIVYFPLYQYSHHIVSKKEDTVKDKKFICGNTMLDKDREIEFNTYLLNLYEKEIDNKDYTFLIKGYYNYKYRINNFITHDEFFDLCNRSEFGLVIKTYSDSIISSNKFHTFLSKNCLPILVKGCDDDSNYIPTELRKKLTVNNGIELYEFINNTDTKELLKELKEHFSEYDKKEFYEQKLRINILEE